MSETETFYLELDGERIELKPRIVITEGFERLFSHYTSLTGEELVEYVRDFQLKALRVCLIFSLLTKVFPYPCIANGGFAAVRVRAHNEYNDVIELAKKGGQLVVDLGCCRSPYYPFVLKLQLAQILESSSSVAAVPIETIRWWGLTFDKSISTWEKNYSKVQLQTLSFALRTSWILRTQDWTTSKVKSRFCTQEQSSTSSMNKANEPLLKLFPGCLHQKDRQWCSESTVVSNPKAHFGGYLGGLAGRMTLRVGSKCGEKF